MTALGKDVSWIEPAIDALDDPSRMDAAIAALESARQSNAVAPNTLFLFYVLLGLADHAFAIADPRWRTAVSRTCGCSFRRRRRCADVRFIELAGRMGLVGYWERHGWPGLVAQKA